MSIKFFIPVLALAMVMAFTASHALAHGSHWGGPALVNTSDGPGNYQDGYGYRHNSSYKDGGSGYYHRGGGGWQNSSYSDDGQRYRQRGYGGGWHNKGRRGHH